VEEYWRASASLGEYGRVQANMSGYGRESPKSMSESRRVLACRLVWASIGGYGHLLMSEN